MALVLDVTPAATTANAYATLADVEAYALTLPVANDWAAATTEQKNAAIVQATRMMDTLDWTGYRINPLTQVLQWPRYYSYDREGFPLPVDVIPWQIRNICCEFAIRLISDDRAADSGGLAPETVKVGSLDVGQMRRRPIPAFVLEMAREFLKSGGAARLVRG